MSAIFVMPAAEYLELRKIAASQRTDVKGHKRASRPLFLALGNGVNCYHKLSMGRR